MARIHSYRRYVPMKSMRTQYGNQSKGSVIILGIHDGHNAGAALVVDGRVIAAISEERLNNQKNYAHAPTLAVRKVFEIAHIAPRDITEIAIASRIRVVDPVRLDGNTNYYLIHRLTEYLAPILHDPWFVKPTVSLLHLFRDCRDTYRVLEDLGVRGKPIQFVDHHLAHAACAYYLRQWEDKTLVLTLDGMGDGVSATVNIGQENKINCIAQTSYYDSIGNNLYSAITQYLGMKRCEHEYKLMGLAPYGKPDGIIDELRELLRINPENPLEFENICGKHLRGMQQLYGRIFSGKRFDNIAAATQVFFEELLEAWVKNAISQTRIHKLAVSGGSFLNVKANMRIRQLDEVDDVFFDPAAEDGGSAVGAALEAYFRYCETHHIQALRTSLGHLYLGEEFDDDHICTFLKSKRLWRKAKQVHAKDIAKLLAEGKIIARFAGRDEWGPRALGNRSIMADPRNASVMRRINMAIKQRDFWMPFAPSILSEYQSMYVKKSRFAPYMIEAFDTTQQARDIIAAIHPYDLTARPQTVNDWNPLWQETIREFYKRTGVAGILNTSFNLHGYPLCGSPQIAYWTFRNSGLDGLILGNWLIGKN